MLDKCPHCDCEEVETEPIRGEVICTSCGAVLDNVNIVNEIQFVDNAQGTSSTVGQYVSDDPIGRRPMLSLAGGFTRESKAITLGRAQKRIKDVAQNLRLSAVNVDTAFNFFKMAHHKNLTKGRKSSLVIGACVYMTCRTAATPHMLIDVSDALQIDVYELGRTYLRLANALCITLPTIDPCLYIWRFADKLSFDKKTHDVCETALRLVTRMKRDWMHMGRRPSGLCGAALVIAARLHNFNRKISDVIKVVKVHESTLKKRLHEFGQTPCSNMTLREFMKGDLAPEEADPPSFKAARKKEQELLISKEVDIDNEISAIQLEIERHLDERRTKLKGTWAKYDKEQTSENNDEASSFINKVTMDSIRDCINPVEIVNTDVMSLRPTVESLNLQNDILDPEENRKDEKISQSAELDLTGIDDDEISTYILSDREMKLKTEHWDDLNKEYLEEVRLKKEREKKEEEEREKDGKPPKKRRKYAPKTVVGPSNTAEEAIEKIIKAKKISSKINYEILKGLDEGFEKKPPLKLPLKSEYSKIESIMRTLTGKPQQDEEDRTEEERNEHMPSESEEEQSEDEETGLSSLLSRRDAD